MLSFQSNNIKGGLHMKLRRYGKNKRELKKLMADLSTRVTQNGFEAKKIFEKLIGYDFNYQILKNNILEVTGIDGESFLIQTDLDLEII